MSNTRDKDRIPHPEKMFETMKEVGGKDLDESRRIQGSMPAPAPATATAPAPTLADAELAQHSSFYDFEGTTMFNGDWKGQDEDFDQFNAIDSNLDLNAFPFTIDEQHPIVTLSTSANETSSEQHTAGTPPPADIPSHENFGLIQELQDDFLNPSDETIPAEKNSWYADAMGTQADSDGLPELNVEGNVPEFTQEDQAILDSFGPAIADEISANYSNQDGLNIASSQTSQAPPARDAVLQGSEQLEITGILNSFEDPTPSPIQSKDEVTTDDQLNSLVEWTEKNYPSKGRNFDQYDENFLPAGPIQSSPMNHDQISASNHQGSTFQPPSEFRESAPVLSVQQTELRQNEAGDAQNRFEHHSLPGQGEHDGYNRNTQMQSGDDSTYAPPPHRNPDLSNGNFDGNNVVSQRDGNGQRGKASQVARKRAGWETRPDAARPRVRMTEEEYQWLRPNEGPRDVFETQRKKAAEERLKEEAEADALEKAGMPRPQPKVQKPYKGGIHIEVWEKDRLNNRRLTQGKSGRDLFTEKPKLRGKRKAREMSEAEPQPESKKVKLGIDRFESHPETRGMNEGLAHVACAGSMPVVDRSNRGMGNHPYSNANPMTSQMNQGITSGGSIHNSYINNYGDNYGDHYGDVNSYGSNYGNNYIGGHYTDPSLGNGVMGTGMRRHGDLGSVPPSGAANPSMSQSSRPEFDGAHQIRAVYSHNQHPESFHSRPEQKVTASYGRNSVPPPPYVESVQGFTNFPPQPPQRPTAPMYGNRTSAPQAVMNPAHEPLASGGNGFSTHLAGQDEQVLRSTDHAYHPNQLRRMIPDSLIDPMLQSQAQFPAPSVMGAQTREHALDNYEYDDDFEDFGFQ
ncbi:uncharacterized protein EAE98_003192 [Botrytis deweyae]|uniref:Uncharacterized protein n=1 Tax=Botrytis deweyae TaxID=2478750 RepID=A0ABQ7IVW6_9HELO|nr:uncharacterized protein EAE98_003192 [Botrytis deweyae]KAF7935147.1 hypothetical protein EAE98_003192 [Botrytis deweyae]